MHTTTSGGKKCKEDILFKKICTVKHGGGIIMACSCLFAVRLCWKNLGNNSNLYQEILLKKSRQQLTSTRSVWLMQQNNTKQWQHHRITDRLKLVCWGELFKFSHSCLISSKKHLVKVVGVKQVTDVRRSFPAGVCNENMKMTVFV